MRDHKVWNSDLGRVFIEGYDKIEKSYCPHCHKDKESCQCGKLDFKDQSAIEAEKNIKKEEGFFKPIYQYGKAPEPGSKAYEAQFDKAKYDEYQTKEQRTLGKGGQAIDKMLNGQLNKDFDGLVKAEPSEIIAANTQANELYRKIKALRSKLPSDPGVKSELDKLTTQHNEAVQKRNKLVGFND